MPWHHGQSLQATGVLSVTPPQALHVDAELGPGSAEDARSGGASSGRTVSSGRAARPVSGDAGSWAGTPAYGLGSWVVSVVECAIAATAEISRAASSATVPIEGWGWSVIDRPHSLVAVSYTHLRAHET